MKTDAVFEGGGVKAIGFIGAVCRLEESGFTWENTAGTSAGAVVASLLAVGYRGIELKKIMMGMNFSKFADKSSLKYFSIIKHTYDIFSEKGIYCTKFIETYLSELYSAKGKKKFKDVSRYGKSRLKIIASDVTQKRLLILPDDLAFYGIDPMEFEIAKAVIMSISIPIVFKPSVIKYGSKKESFIVDGGILSNYPIWIFDVKGVPRWPTFGFKFEKNTDKNKPRKKRNDFIGYMMDIIEAVIDNYDETYISDKDIVRTISIPTNGVKSTDFGISRFKSRELYELGYKSADDFLKTWNFNDYIRKYRGNVYGK